jgi:hypothetical protein
MQMVAFQKVFQDSLQTNITFKAPSLTGAYRLIVFASDDANKKVASGVIPFYVN